VVEHVPHYQLGRASHILTNRGLFLKDETARSSYGDVTAGPDQPVRELEGGEVDVDDPLAT